MALRLWASRAASQIKSSLYLRSYATESACELLFPLVDMTLLRERKSYLYCKMQSVSAGVCSMVQDLSYKGSQVYQLSRVGESRGGFCHHRHNNAQHHLGNVVYVELPEEDGAAVCHGTAFGAVESVKATSDVNSPVSGKVTHVNNELDSSPALINSSPFDNGWIIKVKMSNAGEVNTLMDADQYTKFCEEEDAKH